jgi:hypothetical protein
VNISLGGVTGSGTYPFGPTTSSISVIIGTSSYSSSNAGSSGSVVVSSVDANRLKGPSAARSAGLAAAHSR